MALVNENIKLLRKKKGFTQESFALEVGIKRSSIGSYEENRAMPPANNLIKIAKAFDVSLDQLLHHKFTEKDPDLFQENRSNHNSETINPKDQLKSEFEGLFKQETDLFKNIQEPKGEKKSIKYIKSVLFEKYIRESGSLLYAEGLPNLELPFLDNKDYTAFDAPSDFLIENSILICEKINELSNLNEGQNYLLVTNTFGFIYRRLYNQTKIKGVWLTNSDKSGISSLEIAAHEVKEIWRIVSYFSKTLPQPEISLDSIKRKVEDLKTEIDFITGFRSI